MPDDALGDGIRRKHYPSIYLSLEQRMDMIDSLVNRSDSPLYVDTHLDEARIEASGVALRTRHGSRYSVDGLIAATGRLGGLGALLEQTTYRRHEIGVRIETPHDESPLNAFSATDPKVLGQSSLNEEVEWRTFCACRNGRVVFGNMGEARLASGRADCPPTGVSNFGLLVRAVREEIAGQLGLDEAVHRVAQRDFSFSANLLSERRNSYPHLEIAFGSRAAAFLSSAIDDLLMALDATPTPSWRIVGPCVEGTGWYPSIASDLRHTQSDQPPIFVAGDYTGSFRGITAAFISGFFASSQMAGVLST